MTISKDGFEEACHVSKREFKDEDHSEKHDKDDKGGDTNEKEGRLKVMGMGSTDGGGSNGRELAFCSGSRRRELHDYCQCSGR
jgi:hypothetical protein